MPQNRYGTIKVQEDLLSTMPLPNLVSQQFMKYLSIVSISSPATSFRIVHPMYCMIHWMYDSFIRFIYIWNNEDTEVSLHKRIAFSANKISGICTQCKLSLTLFYSQKEEKTNKQNIKKKNKQNKTQCNVLWHRVGSRVGLLWNVLPLL